MVRLMMVSIYPTALLSPKRYENCFLGAEAPNCRQLASRGGGTRTHTPSQDPDFKSGASADSATPPGIRSGVYQLVIRILRTAATAFRVGALEAPEGPF